MPTRTTLLVDNYDSFTFNLYALIDEARGTPPVVVTNDVDFDSIDWDRFDSVVVSPGPGTPDHEADVGIGFRVFRETDLPVLGVCLGHQILCAAYGGRIVRAPQPAHGQLSTVHHDGTGLFAGVDDPMTVVRYHSLIAVDLPSELAVTARTSDGLIMAVHSTTRPQWGVQFHPESIAGQHGSMLMRNFLDLAGARADRRPDQPVRTPDEPTPRFRLQHRAIRLAVDTATVHAAAFADAPRHVWLDGTAERSPDRRLSILGDDTGPHADAFRAADDDDAVAGLRHGLAERTADVPDDYPLDVGPGYFGYLGYEAHTGGPNDRAAATTGTTAEFLFLDRIVVVDHDTDTCVLVWLDDESTAQDGRDWADHIERLLRRTGTADPAPNPDPRPFPMTFRFGRDDYLARIDRALDAIRAGETYEVCLTNEVVADVAVDPIRLFTELRLRSPAPYATLLRLDSVSVVSASPERFLRVSRAGLVESKPIKGTRRRGATPAEDLAAADDLRTSAKEVSENLMIVDLVRNDLTRVCVPDSVDVPVLFGIESYATVHQMVSTVVGLLRPEASALDAIAAAFPPGSMTGAPKLRTTSLLRDLEVGTRGVYSGALGWVSVTGAADLSVVIRTVVVDGDRVSFGVGGAITALSDPSAEHDEILLKAEATIAALEAVADHHRAAPGRGASGPRRSDE